MNRLQSFQGWRFNPGLVDLPAVVTPPPWAIVTDRVNSLYLRSPMNVVRLVHGRNFAHDGPADNELTRAAAHLDSWREQEYLLRDRDAVYIYEREFESEGKGISWQGFICRLLLPETDNPNPGIFELWPGGQTADPGSLARLNVLRGHLVPLQGFVEDSQSEIARALEDASCYDPLAEFAFDWGGLHRIRILDHPEPVNRILAAAEDAPMCMPDRVGEFMAAITYRNQVRQAMQAAGREPPVLGELDCDWLMVWLVPTTEISPQARELAGAGSCGALAGMVFDLFW